MAHNNALPRTLRNYRIAPIGVKAVSPQTEVGPGERSPAPVNVNTLVAAGMAILSLDDCGGFDLDSVGLMIVVNGGGFAVGDAVLKVFVAGGVLGERDKSDSGKQVPWEERTGDWIGAEMKIGFIAA